MVTIKRYHLLHFLTFSLLLGIVWSCIGDHHIVPSNKTNRITLSVKVPGANSPKVTLPKTRALTELNENEIREIVVLLFDTEGNYTYIPIYRNSSDIVTDSGDSRIKTFTIEVPEGEYDMIVLANSNTVLNSVLSTIAMGQSKASVLEKLVVTNSGKWNSLSPSYTPIPMWGEIEGVVVNNNMSQKSVSLIRMVAKIDVTLSTIGAKSNFNLESVHLYNYYDKGQIAPNEGSWDIDTKIITIPSIPIGAKKPLPVGGNPLLYDGIAITKESSRGISCVNEIYTFESIIGENSLLSNTCLVVGGKYGGDRDVTYYRIEFANTIGLNTTATFLPLLRNHNYKVNIKAVNGSGFLTPEAAFNSNPTNVKMVASILIWDNSQITNIVFDGQYMLGVSQDNFTLSNNPRFETCDDNTLSITTDVPSGWNIYKIVDANNNDINTVTNLTTGWLQATINTGTNGSTTTTKLLLTENNTGVSRTGFIHIKAGRLNYTVKVVQLETSKVEINITTVSSIPIPISTIEFISTVDALPNTQQFQLAWFPKASEISFTSRNITQGAPFSFNSGTVNINGIDTELDVIPASGAFIEPSGIKTYTIRPPAITTANLNPDPLYERNSLLLYTISDGTITINKTLVLRQYVPNFVPIVADYFLMDGTTKSFGVRSNVPFTISVKSDPSNVITKLHTTSGGVNISPSGTPIYFNIIDDQTNPTLFWKDVVFTVKSLGGHFPDRDITLTCQSGIFMEESNSYIVATNSTPIFIPVSRANKSKIGDQLFTDDTYTAELVWTDNSVGLSASGLSPDANIQKIAPAGTGPSGYIFVRPGSAEGNALVAIKKDGNILWTWHIWVANYSPTPSTSGGFMDRNLGALRSTYGNALVNGLYYQWGRKDPFPSSASYNALGSSVTVSGANFTSNENFANAVANPTVVYNNTTSNDWHGATGYQDNNLWGASTGDKTVYDPCPLGWRVASDNSVWSALTNTNFAWENNGRTNLSYGGFYPAAGWRNGAGSILNVGEQGRYWSGGAAGNLGKDLYFSSGTTSINRGSNNRYNAYSIRCVKIN